MKEPQLNDIFYMVEWPLYRMFAEEKGYTIKEIEPEIDKDGNKVRRFKIVEIEKHIPTNEEQRQARALAYQQEKDPITCQIQSLRDEDPTEEIIAEIEELKQKRAEKVQEIKERFPYSEEE